MGDAHHHSEPFLCSPHLYTEHKVLIETASWSHWFHCQLQRWRTPILVGILAAHALPSSIEQDPLALVALRSHFKGAVSATAVGLFCAVLILSTWIFCKKKCRSMVCLLPSLCAYILCLYCSRIFKWEAASGLWLAILVVGWSMKAVTFIRLPQDPPPRFSAWAKFLLLCPHLVWQNPNDSADKNSVASESFSDKWLRALSEAVHCMLSFLVVHVILQRHVVHVLHDLESAVSRSAHKDAAVAILAICALTLPLRLLCFYGFWHAGAGCLATLSGTSRNLYGPWWLVREHPAPFFRLWSSPVHIWLKECVYKPLLPIIGAGWSSLLTHVTSSLLHEAVMMISMRTVVPISSFNLMSAAVLIPWWASILGGGSRAIDQRKETTLASVTFVVLTIQGQALFVYVVWKWWLQEFGTT